MSGNNFDQKPESFEQAISELNQLVSKLEKGELSLESSIEAYKKGVELVKYCNTQLDRAEKQIQILDGELLKPFSAEDNIGVDNG